MKRSTRAQLAQETLQILKTGAYQVQGGRSVSVGKALQRCCAGTRLYRPSDYSTLLLQIEALPRRDHTTIQVSNRSTLAAGRDLAAMYPSMACLNFASAMNPGGGFLNGSQAQEESLARSSGLYATLLGQQEFYSYHRRLGTSLYSDHVIFSPEVPVFRDDDGQLLTEAWLTAFLTSPAVNAGAIRQNEPSRVCELVTVMEQRTRMILAVAAAHQCEALVLGAWGCGVFQNEPKDMAAIFAKVLAEPLFRNRFSHIDFAVYDRSDHCETFEAFRGSFLERESP